MTATHDTTKRKSAGTPVTFEGPAGIGIEPRDLVALPDVAAVERVAPQDRDVFYHDTADLRLLAHAVTLQHRTGGRDTGWRLELPGPEGGPGARHSAPAPGSGGIPEELALRIRAYARGQDVVPVAHLRTRRHGYRLTGKHRRVLAEVTVDEVTAQLLDAERPAHAGSAGAGTSARLTAWTQVAVRPVRGDGALVRKAARTLTAAGLRRTPDGSQLSHALGGAAASPAPGLTRLPAGSAGEAIALRLRRLVAELYAADPAVRADEPDAVHRMRVAVRRLRALLRTHRDLLDRRRTDPLAAELGRLGSVLGSARDEEVLAARLARQAAALPPDLVAGPVAERIATEQAEAYRRQWRQAVTELDSPRYHSLLDALDAAVADPPLRRRAGKKAVRQLEKAVRREQRRLTARIAAADAAAPGPERDAALHSARKAAKRARYAAETAAPYAGRPAKRFAQRAKAVQSLLGEHQDAVLARAALPGLAERARTAGESGFTYGVLHTAEQAAAEEYERRLPAVAARVRKRRLTRFT